MMWTVRDVPFKIMIGLIDDVFIINKLYCGHVSNMRKQQILVYNDWN